jgi:hypothetical protein
MISGRYAGFLAAGAILGVLSDAAASPLDALQGAWTMEGFSDRNATQTTGIIVSGNKISAPNSNCTVGRVRLEKDHFAVQLTCADTITFSSLSVAFKVIDKNSFERFDPAFPDISFLYHKCFL